VITLLFLLIFGGLVAIVVATIIAVWLMALFAVLAVRIAFAFVGVILALFVGRRA
jgi:hypothetical protein